METQKFIRRPFDVNVVQVTPQNVEEVAQWCGGKLGEGVYKLAGFDTKLPTVLVPGNGPNKGQLIEARIGSYVVEHNKKFRVFRKHEFTQTFIKEEQPSSGYFQAGDLVQDTSGWQGEVLFVDQILVESPGHGNILYSAPELTKISEYSEETKHKIAELVDSAIGVDKLNVMREAAEAMGPSGVGCFPPATGSLEEPPTEINGITKGSVIRVRDELNQFFSQCGVVEEILTETMLSIKMEMQGNPVVKHLVREVELEESTRWVKITNDVSPQFGWVGWVVSSDQEVEDGVVRVAFRPTTFLSGTNDRCFSYMATEITPMSHQELGKIPTYEI